MDYKMRYNCLVCNKVFMDTHDIPQHIQKILCKFCGSSFVVQDEECKKYMSYDGIRFTQICRECKHRFECITNSAEGKEVKKKKPPLLIMMLSQKTYVKSNIMRDG